MCVCGRVCAPIYTTNYIITDMNKCEEVGLNVNRTLIKNKYSRCRHFMSSIHVLCSTSARIESRHFNKIERHNWCIIGKKESNNYSLKHLWNKV
jgi:hypothetical protein